MRYLASEKLEIIRLVEGSHLSHCLTGDVYIAEKGANAHWRSWAYRAQRSIAPSRASLMPCRSTGYSRYLGRGEAGLEDCKSYPGRVWNRIPDTVRQAMLEMALARPELSPRELAATFTDERRYFVSEASG